ncbi:MAG: CRISPR-associated protein [Bacillota bacterium]
MDYYIAHKESRLGNRSLLEAELEYFHQEDRLKKLQPCRTLILLVGLSPEPLLQSICVFRPQEIALIFNKEYINEQWNEYAGHIYEALEKLKQNGLIDCSTTIVGEKGSKNPGYVTEDNPAAVFQTLRKVINELPSENKRKDVVIDITGGKKSMVAGAFLFAAYAGLRISYVDFEEYDPDHRRPYGFSCRVGELNNPYARFALQAWERLRTLYEQYQFREAQALLKDINEAMSEVLPEIREPIAKLRQYLDYYEKWESGNWRGAKKLAASLQPFKQPTAVDKLGDQWYAISGNSFQPVEKFYGDDERLKIYAYDELQRIKRLIEKKQDYRAAFLRAGSLSEIINIFRLVRLVKEQCKNKSEVEQFLEALDENTPFASNVFNALLKKAGDYISIGKYDIKEKKDLAFGDNTPEIRIKLTKPTNKWWNNSTLFKDKNYAQNKKAQKGWRVFLDVRNKLAHAYFSVPEDWAREALAFVEANLADWLGGPVEEKCRDLYARALPWSKLCQLCGVSQFLPPLLDEEDARD